MKKFLIFIGFLLVILFAVVELVLPQILSNMLRDQVARLTAAPEVSVSVDSTPRFMIVAGRVDEINAEVSGGHIGDLETASLALDGHDVQVDMPAILFGLTDENKKLDVDKVLKSVGNVEMRGTVTEDNLTQFLTTRFNQIEEIDLKMTPEGITSNAKIRIMNRSAEVELDGIIIIDDGDLYFRATRLNVQNALLRHVQLDRFFADLKIVDASKLPLDLKFSGVEMQQGQTILTATNNPQVN